MSTTPIFNELAEATGLEFDEDGTLAAANGSAEPIEDSREDTASDTADEGNYTAQDEAGETGESAENTSAMHRAAS